MRGRLTVVLVTLVLTTSSLSAKDVYLAVTGKANGFFTDARIFNPSFDKDINIQAWYLPAGGGDNSGVAPITITIPKRTMKVYDDAVQSIFSGGPALGAIRLSSEDDFMASQRIYQDARSGPQAGTLGQFVQGQEISAAKTKGVMLQLKSGPTTLGPFRTNWGGVNPNGTAATVTFKLYDKLNAVVVTKEVTMPPFAVFAPAPIQPFFNNTPADLTDAWISFTSTQPVFLYCSVVDSGSSDPTFIAAVDDSGTPPPPPPPPPAKTVTVHADDGSFTVSGTNGLARNDEVKFVVTGEGGVHGFRLFGPDGTILFTLDPLSSNPSERTITLTDAGTYQYICTRLTCSLGHAAMTGDFTIGPTAPDNPGDRY